MRTMRKVHKGLLIGGVTLAVLVPASMVAADQIDMGNGHGDGHGRGNGSMLHDCTGDESGEQIRARDGTGPRHATNTADDQARPMGGTGNQWGSRR
jgi:hypothetical protein